MLRTSRCFGWFPNIRFFVIMFEIEVDFHMNSSKQPEQQKIQLCNRISIIAATLARMPKLQGLILKNHWLPPRDSPSYIYFDKDIKNVALYGPRTSRHFLMAEENPYAIPVKCDFGQSENYDYGFKIMRNALAISDVRLKSFCVDYINNSELTSPTRLDGLHLSTFSKMSTRYTCNAFRYCRKISLSLDWYTMNPDDEHNNLVEILAAVKNMEELTLSFTVIGNKIRM